MKTIRFENEKATFVTPTWQEMDTHVFEISKQIIADGKEFDRVVTLAKGGWPMTRSLVGYLDIPEVASIGVKFYKGIGERNDIPEIYQDIPVSLKGENILLFDDVVDTGESMVFVKDHLKDLGVKSVTLASIYYKPHACIKPDYFGEETSDWIIFPYDLRETIELFAGKWASMNVSKGEIFQRFAQLGFDSSTIQFYLSLVFAV